MSERSWPWRRAAGKTERATPRILVVDDEAEVRDVVRRILEPEGLELLEAGNGQEALAVVEQQSAPIDLLLTDLQMPVMDGEQLATAVRSRFPKMKVLFLTGMSERLFVRGEILPQDCAFEDKPITPGRLREAVYLLLYGTLAPPDSV